MRNWTFGCASLLHESLSSLREMTSLFNRKSICYISNMFSGFLNWLTEVRSFLFPPPQVAHIHHTLSRFL